MLWRILRHPGPGPRRLHRAARPPRPRPPATHRRVMGPARSSAAGSSGRAPCSTRRSRGLKVALVEQDDIAVGTSSRSSRLIHGGLRYLRQLDVRLVREALHERARLLRLAPHLVRLEEFLFPLYGLADRDPGLLLDRDDHVRLPGFGAVGRPAPRPVEGRRRSSTPRTSCGTASAAGCCTTTRWRTTPATRSRSSGRRSPGDGAPSPPHACGRRAAPRRGPRRRRRRPTDLVRAPSFEVRAAASWTQPASGARRPDRPFGSGVAVGAAGAREPPRDRAIAHPRHAAG